MIFGYSIIGTIVEIILGVLAKFVMPGKQAVPLWLTILVGIVAAIIGNYVATLLGVRETFGFDSIRHGLQLLFAVLGIGALAGVYAEEGLIDRSTVLSGSTRSDTQHTRTLLTDRATPDPDEDIRQAARRALLALRAWRPTSGRWIYRQ